MAWETGVEEKYGICDMKACKPEDGGQPRMELLRLFKDQYRCFECYKIAVSRSSLTCWRSANESEYCRGETFKPGETIQIYLKTGDRSIAVDVTPGCTIDIDNLIGSSSGQGPKVKAMGPKAKAMGPKAKAKSPKAKAKRSRDNDHAAGETCTK